MSSKKWALIHVRACDQIAVYTARDPSDISNLADLCPGIIFPACQFCKKDLTPSDFRVRYFEEVKH